MPERVDVAVVGGGLIGLASAWRLAGRGLTVAVIERETVGFGASLAATGMLAPAAEHEPGSDPLLPLALDSLARWPGFRDDLEAASACRSTTGRTAPWFWRSAVTRSSACASATTCSAAPASPQNGSPVRRSAAWSRACGPP